MSGDILGCSISINPFYVIFFIFFFPFFLNFILIYLFFNSFFVLFCFFLSFPLFIKFFLLFLALAFTAAFKNPFFLNFIFIYLFFNSFFVVFFFFLSFPLFITLFLLFPALAFTAAFKNDTTFPPIVQGDWFSWEDGRGKETEIFQNEISGRGKPVDRRVIRRDIYEYVFAHPSGCFVCSRFLVRSWNVMERSDSEC